MKGVRVKCQSAALALYSDPGPSNTIAAFAGWAVAWSLIVILVAVLVCVSIAVGFGVSTADQVRHVTRSADAAIVGSALVRRMSEAADPAAAAREFVTELARGLDRT